MSGNGNGRPAGPQHQGRLAHARIGKSRLRRLLRRRLTSELKTLRAELGDVNDVLADARAREGSAVLDRLREDVALLGSPNRKSAVRWAMTGRRANG